MTTGKQWNTARKLRHIRGKLHTGSTTMVTITDENGQRRGITEKKEIERAIMDNNMAKFLQSSHIPFYQSPLQGRVCFKGLPSASQAVLAGVYDSNYDVNPAVLDVIAQWQLPSSVRNIGPQKLLLLVEQYKKLWRKAKENTGCYPSAMSFSTMKAGSFDDKIAALECTLTKQPLEKGFAPQHWTHCLDVMILRKSGVTDLSSLQTIVLFPVDCNYAFKHIGREMMKTAEKTGSLALEQYGSHKRHWQRNVHYWCSMARSFGNFL